MSATGLVVVDKEAGWTSHDVVARCRGIFGQRKVGHAGTLDPDATGVLLVGLGRVTRLLRFLTALPKTYTTDIVLGTATSTLDASGEVLGTYDMSGVTPEAVQAAADALTGEIEQVPPMVSAVKVGGRRLHELARQGVEVERAARPVTVWRFDTQPDVGRPGRLPGRDRMLVGHLRAGAGPGPRPGPRRRRARGQPAPYPDRLVRRHRDAHPRAASGADDVLTPAEALRDLEQVRVDAAAAASIRTGLPLDKVPLGATGEGPWAMLDEDGELLAVYEGTGTDRIRPAVVVAGG